MEGFDRSFKLSDVKSIDIDELSYDDLSDSAKKYCKQMVEFYSYFSDTMGPEDVLVASLRYDGYKIGDNNG